MTMTLPVVSVPGVRSTAVIGTVRAWLRLSVVNFTSAYIPGMRVKPGLGTSTSVSMVRVESCTRSEKRATLPGKVRFRVGTRTVNPCPTRTRDTTDSGTGRIKRSRLFSERRTTGIACVWDAVPAWIMDPVLA